MQYCLKLKYHCIPRTASLTALPRTGVSKNLFTCFPYSTCHSRKIKRLDDKNLLIEIQIVESRVYYEVKNVARSKVSCRAACK